MRIRKFAFVIFFVFTANLFANNCPDPNTTSLQWGVPPEPWLVHPFSKRPQGEANTQFVQSNILVIAGIGRGVTCTYHNSLGNYSIWWPVLVKIPSPQQEEWIDALGGFVCVRSLPACIFSVAPMSH